MTRVFSVTPIDVSAEELHRRRQRYARLSPAGLTVHLENIGSDGPVALASDADVEASQRAVTAALERASGGGWDALLPDCVLDPGVPPDGESSDPPVLGALGLVLPHLNGHRFGAIARNHIIANHLRRRVIEWGYGDMLTEVSVLDLDVTSIADPQRWNDAMETSLTRLAALGTTTVLNGCSAVDVVSEHSVLDPMAVALELLAVKGKS